MAGNLLARQLSGALPGQSIGLFEQTVERGHAVGESMVEIASNYLIRRLGLSTYLYDRQYPKNGLRYFFDSAARDTALHEMSEIGSDALPIYPAFQIDRSRFENDLLEMNRMSGVMVRRGSKVEGIELGTGGHPHRIRVSGGSATESFDCRWAGTEVDEETSNLRVEDMTECVAAIEATPCSDVQEYGDDPSYWISLSDRCAWLYDGAEVPVDRFRTEGS